MKLYDPIKKTEYTADIPTPHGSGEGLLGVPLFLDMHTHVRYPQFEGYDTLGEACLKGGFGICTIQPNTKPRLERASTIEIHKRASQGYPVKFIFTASLFGEDTSMGVAYSTDGLEYTAEQLWYALNTHTPRLLMDHSQIYEIEGMFYPGAPYPSYRPLRGESIAVFRTVMLGIEAGWSRFHIQHITSSHTVQTIQHLKKYASVTSEITPHHLLLSAEDISTPNMKINPPLAPEKDRKTLIDMTKKGLIDVLATDHAPHPPKPENYEKAPYGSSHIEVAFSAFYTALGDIHTVVDMLTVKPAKILGVDIPPMPENMVVIDPKATFTVDSKEFASLGKNTAFEGMTLGGKVVGVKIGGTWRYWDGQFLEV